MARMLDRLNAPEAPAVVVVGFRPEDPLQYGRIIVAGDGTIEKMVEYKDASPEERAVNLCNSGMMAARAGALFDLLARVGNHNAAGEIYLPAHLILGAKDGRPRAALAPHPGGMA